MNRQSGRASDARAVFLDRDGVINELVWDSDTSSYESPYAPEDVALAAGAVQGLWTLRDAGFKLIVVSNQPNAAKRRATLKMLQLVHERVEDLLSDAGIKLDDYRYCFHYPDGEDPTLTIPCNCRKPEPGLLIDVGRQDGLNLAACWMVGDSDSDIIAGLKAGCRTVLIDNSQSTHRRNGAATPEVRVANLLEAADYIVNAVTRSG